MNPSLLNDRKSRKRYFLNQVAIGVHSETVTADNLVVSENWENIQLMCQ